jgi:hypothetical protein
VLTRTELRVTTPHRFVAGEVEAVSEIVHGATRSRPSDVLPRPALPRLVHPLPAVTPSPRARPAAPQPRARAASRRHPGPFALRLTLRADSGEPTCDNEAEIKEYSQSHPQTGWRA